MNDRKALTVADLIERLKELPPEAMIHVTRPFDINQSVTGPAYDVEFSEIGPLLYVNLA